MHSHVLLLTNYFRQAQATLGTNLVGGTAGFEDGGDLPLGASLDAADPALIVLLAVHSRRPDRHRRATDTCSDVIRGHCYQLTIDWCQRLTVIVCAWFDTLIYTISVSTGTAIQSFLLTTLEGKKS